MNYKDPRNLSHSKTTISSFSELNPYITYLRQLALIDSKTRGFNKEFEKVLNGGPSKELRRAISIDLQRKYGAFFTSKDLGDYLLKDTELSGGQKVVYDPCCGMGDLLLAAARKLPLKNSLKQTIINWGEILIGTDIHPEFIEATKSRLFILARARHKSYLIEHINWRDCFPKIHVSDGLIELDDYLNASIILLNPPYGRVMVSHGCDWAKGKISESAKFIINALEKSKDETEILSILPDVLRSGTIYERWRKKVDSIAEIKHIETYGLFDKKADIDVFLLKINNRRKYKKNSKNSWPDFNKEHGLKVNNFFHVNVGRVVPHRDEETGREYAYIHPRCVPAWSIIKEFSESRKHKGLPFIPPFVVIRRTSRPGDLYRANASIITGKKPILVENHFIVCKPKDSKLKTCRKLMRELKKDYVNQYLNQRIRCRHLTINSVKMIPVCIE
jgi:N-6 DNA Methylase